MKKIFIILTICFATICCKQKDHTPDKSLKRNDSLPIFLKKAFDESLSYDVRFRNNMKALSIVSKQKNDSTYRFYYFKITNRFWNMNAMQEYKSATIKLIEKTTQSHDYSGLAKAYTYMADYYEKGNNQDSLYYFNNKAEKLYKELKDNTNTAKVLLKKALLQHKVCDYFGCEKTIFELLKINRIVKDTMNEYEANNLLGIIYSQLDDFALSSKYYSKNLSIAKYYKTPHEKQLIATTLNNIGFSYFSQKKYAGAEKLYVLALEEPNVRRDRPDIYAILIDNLAYVRFKKGNFNNLPQKFYESLKIRDSIGFDAGILINKKHLSEFYALKKDTLTAIKLANEMYELALRSEGKKYILSALRQLSAVNPKNAYKYSLEYYKTNDSIEIADRRLRNDFARIEYETDELQRQKSQLKQDRDKTLGTLNIVLIGFTFIVLIAIILYLIHRRKVKNRELALLKEQQKANEEIYTLMLSQHQKIEEGKQLEKKRISQELHDGIMGRLTSIRLNLFVLSRKHDPETIANSLKHIDDIQNVEKEIRTIAYDLGNDSFGSVNFITVVKNIFMAMENYSGIYFKFDIDENINWNIIDNHIKIQIYRILQEAMQNIVKYAQAYTVSLIIAQSVSSIQISIIDDGVGFDGKKVKKGFGLRNMKERANEINGEFRIESIPDKGTTITLTIPNI